MADKDPGRLSAPAAWSFYLVGAALPALFAG